MDWPGLNVGSVVGTGAPTLVTAPVRDAASVQPEMDLVQVFFARKPASEPVFWGRLIELGVAVRVGWQRFGPIPRSGLASKGEGSPPEQASPPRSRRNGAYVRIAGPRVDGGVGVMHRPHGAPAPP